MKNKASGDRKGSLNNLQNVDTMKYMHIFGPVPSRRLGLSLGVDLVYHKVCSLDCIYCECGKTTDLRVEQQEFVGFDEVKRELDDYFINGDDPDYITFSGSGEPTLNMAIGRVIAYIKERRPGVKVAVLTNSTLLGSEDVQQALAGADLVMPSLDAVFQETFLQINRPCKGLSIDAIVDGLKAFARRFTGEIWLEVFIVPGVNDSAEELMALKGVVHDIRPERVQLNTLDRPGALQSLSPASMEELERVAEILEYEWVEVIAKVKSLQQGNRKSIEDMEPAVVETIHRRPCTVEDLAQALNLDEAELEILLKKLVIEQKIEAKLQKRGLFYQTRK